MTSDSASNACPAIFANRVTRDGTSPINFLACGFASNIRGR